MKKNVARAFAALFAITLFAPVNGWAEEHDHDHGQEHDHVDANEHAQDQDHGHEKGHDHEAGASRFGPGKAIEAVREEGKHFKLSEKAKETIGVKLAEVERVKPDVFKLPRAALVYYQDKIGVYVRRDGWFEIIGVKPTPGSNSLVTVTASGLRPGDHVAVGGVPLLRIAHLEAMGQGGQGHVH